MNRIINIATILFQIGLTFITTICIYMIFALLDYQGGFDGFIGMTIFQPIIAVIFSVLTIIICFLFGLPIRLNRNIYKWWINRFYIPVSGIILGFIILCLSLLPYFMTTVSIQVEGQNAFKSIPNPYLILIGWFITAFSALHLFPLTYLKRKLKFVSEILKKEIN